MAKNEQGLASHTESSDESDIHAAKHRIKRQLERYAGKNNNGVTSQMLARQVSVGQSTVKDIIQQLRADGLPVVSGPTGYKVIESREELKTALQKIDEEIETREKTKQQLAQGFNQRYYGDDNE